MGNNNIFRKSPTTIRNRTLYLHKCIFIFMNYISLNLYTVDTSESVLLLLINDFEFE